MIYATAIFLSILGALFAGRCPYNGVRKLTSSANKETFLECKPFQKNSCCTADVDRSIHQFGQLKLDGTKWDLCGPLSKKCEAYFKRETCFYECSPDLEKYIVPFRKGTERYRGIPVCAESCDQWYEACRYDMTCAKNWITGMKWRKSGNSCKEGQPCRTFEEMYGSGKALCENIWWNTLVYVSGDKRTCHKIWPDV